MTETHSAARFIADSYFHRQGQTSISLAVPGTAGVHLARFVDHLVPAGDDGFAFDARWELRITWPDGRTAGLYIEENEAPQQLGQRILQLLQQRG